MTQILTTTWRRIRATARSLRIEERGASALEWAIIAAVAVVVASVVGVAVTSVVRDRTANLEECAAAASTAECENGTPGGGTAPE